MNSTTMDSETIAPEEADYSSFWRILDIVYTVVMPSSASVSIIGSITIVYKILRDRAQNASMTPYDRFVVGVSCGDILFSIFLPIAFSGFLDRNTSSASCRAIGAFGALAIGSFWYNGLLSFYFLLTVLSQVRRKNLVQRFEPWMHLSVMYFPIVAILTCLFGWFRLDDSGTYCYTDPVLYVVAFIPLGLSILAMVVNYSVIYAVVRKTLRSPNGSSENADGSIPVRKQLFRESTTIMALYVGFYLVVFLTGFILVVVELIFGVDGGFFEIVAGFFFAFLMPLQGLFNAVIYLKPFYTRFRAAYPYKSKWFVLRQAVLNSKAPRTHHRRIANDITHRSNVLITDITLGEERLVNPNEALFDPGRWPSSSDPSDNAEDANEEE